ncbi:MAG: GNAT family N-acetyltransferase [Sphingomonas adhaesiva]|uniref:GNAT family N-acetyltransferase n=1 Tax=Sphingomonas adhaesiva TaxID=28212 RepID=UPI002FF6D489
MGAGSRDDGWRVERACALAWPAREELAVGGWRVSRSGGGTRRTNSASPAGPGARLDDATIAAIRDAYAAVAQPAIVRVPTLLPGIDTRLDRHGFLPAEGPTLTIACDVLPRRGDAGVRVRAAPDAAWIAARRALSVAAGGGAQDHLAPIARLAVPTVFAATQVEGAVRSLAFAAVHDGLAIVEAVATDAGWRGRGLARRTVAALLHATAAIGARGAALRVMADNGPARALYRALGFDRHLYDYHYRRSPA